jgi:hypothetical protein
MLPPSKLLLLHFPSDYFKPFAREGDLFQALAPYEVIPADLFLLCNMR